MFVGIQQGVQHLVGVVLLSQGPGGTGYDALAAGDTVYLGQIPVKGRTDVGGEAPLIAADDAYLLELPAGGDAPAAEDALGVVPHQVEGALLQLGTETVVGVAHRVDTQVGGQLPQFTVGVAGTGEAVHPMVGEDELQGELPGVADLGSVGKDLHPLADRIDAGGHQAPGPFYLHHAHPAGSDLIDPFQEAQGRDLDARRAGGLQDGSALGDGNGDIVDGEIDHFLFHIVLPPYLFSMASKWQLSIQTPHLMHLEVSMV